MYVCMYLCTGMHAAYAPAPESPTMCAGGAAASKPPRSRIPLRMPSRVQLATELLPPPGSHAPQPPRRLSTRGGAQGRARVSRASRWHVAHRITAHTQLTAPPPALPPHKQPGDRMPCQGQDPCTPPNRRRCRLMPRLPAHASALDTTMPSKLGPLPPERGAHSGLPLSGLRAKMRMQKVGNFSRHTG